MTFQTVLVVCLWMTILTLIVFNAWLRQEIKREQRKIDMFKSHRVSKKIEQKLHRHAYEIKPDLGFSYPGSIGGNGDSRGELLYDAISVFPDNRSYQPVIISTLFC